MSLDDDPRFKALSPREQATMRSLLGGGGGGRRYDPYDRSLFGSGGRTIDANHFGAMREYYTRGQRNKPPAPIKTDIRMKRKEMLALPAAPVMLMITEKATC